MRRFLGWTLGIVLLLVVAVVLLLAFPPTGWIADKIEETVAARTGYTLSIGDLELDLLDWTPSATVSTVSLDGAAVPELLRAGQLEAAVDLGAALGGDLAIVRVALADAEVRAVRKADGTSSWTPAMVEAMEESVQTDSDRFELPTIREMSLKNVDVIWDDAVSGTEARLAVEASGSTLPDEKPLVATVDGTVNTAPVNARLELTSPLGDAIAGEPVQLALDAALGELEASLSGQLGEPLAAGRTDLAFEANADALAALETVLGRELPALAPATLSGSLTGEGGAYVADVEGSIKEAPLAARLELESPDGGDPLAGDPVQLALEASLDGLEASVAGRVGEPDTLGNVELDVEARADSLAGLESVLDRPLPDLAPATFSASLITEGDEYVVRRFDLAAAGSSAEGDVRLDPGTEPPTVYANLISKRLDVDGALEALGMTEEVAEEVVEADEDAPGGPLLSSDPLPIDALFGTVQGAVALRIDELRLEALPLEAFDGRLELAPASVTLSVDEARLAGGEVGATLTAEPNDGAGLDAKLELELSRVRVGRLVPDVELVDDVGGPLGGQAELWVSGDSVAALAGSLDGGVTLLMGQGRLDALLVELGGLDLLQALGDLIEPGEEEFPLRCAYASLLAESGTITVGDFVIDSVDTVFVADGSVDLGAETLDLSLEPHPKDASVAAASTGVRIGGRLGALEIDVDAELPARAAAAAVLAAVATPAAALLAFIETGGGEDSGFCDLEGALDGDGG